MVKQKNNKNQVFKTIPVDNEIWNVFKGLCSIDGEPLETAINRVLKEDNIKRKCHIQFCSNMEKK